MQSYNIHSSSILPATGTLAVRVNPYAKAMRAAKAVATELPEAPQEPAPAPVSEPEQLPDTAPEPEVTVVAEKPKKTGSRRKKKEE